MHVTKTLWWIVYYNIAYYTIPTAIVALYVIWFCCFLAIVSYTIFFYEYRLIVWFHWINVMNHAVWRYYGQTTLQYYYNSSNTPLLITCTRDAQTFFRVSPMYIVMYIIISHILRNKWLKTWNINAFTLVWQGNKILQYNYFLVCLNT